jgi:hypothetical protein
VDESNGIAIKRTGRIAPELFCAAIESEFLLDGQAKHACIVPILQRLAAIFTGVELEANCF